MTPIKLAPRTLVKLGQNSLVISLPKEWIVKHRLVKGNLIYAHEESNNLILSSHDKESAEETELTIEIGKKSFKYLMTEIISAYLAGYDIIRVTGSRLKNNSVKIKSVMHGLVGLEIMEETKEKIVAKELLDIDKTSLAHTFRRVDYIVRGMFEDLMAARAKDDYKHVYERDRDVNRLTYLIYRIINKAFDYPSLLHSIATSYRELFKIRKTIFSLEKIGDSIKRLAKIGYFRKIFYAETEQILSLLKLFKDTYTRTLEAHYKNDMDEAINIEIENAGRIQKCKNFLHDDPKYVNAEISYLLQDISRSLREIARNLC